MICHYAKEIIYNIGLYTPLLVLESPWVNISMKFVFGFPKNQKGNDSIFVVVDRISKMEHFIPFKKEINAKGITAFFFKYIVRLHGFSKTITLNRDTKFMGNFWRNLWNYFGYKVIVHLCMYHP